MPVYQYKARDGRGKIIEDIIYSASKSAATNELARQGFEVVTIDIQKNEVYATGSEYLTNISLQELARFSRYFAILIKGGVPVLECLEILHGEARSKTLKVLILKVKNQVEGGMALHTAFDEHKQYMPKLFIDLIKVGELSGKLFESFMRITEYLEKTIEFRRKLRDALTYPAFLVFFIFLLVTYVITLLIPRFEEIYKALEGELPMPTQILLSVGQFSRDNFWLIIGSIFLLIILYVEFAATKFGKRLIDHVKLRLPMASPLIIQYNIANFVKSASLMFFSGYTFLNSMREAVNTVENIPLAEDLNLICERIENGQSIYEAFKKGKYIPTFTTSMLKVGEKSNNLYEMLGNIVDFNERELDYATQTFLRVMEPVIIVALAVVVGTILFAAYLPVLSMSRLIKV